MPIYDYQCVDCKAEFEAHSSVHDRQTSRCGCGGLARKCASGSHFFLDPVSGHFPTRTDQWERSHEKANKDDLKSLGLR